MRVTNQWYGLNLKSKLVQPDLSNRDQPLRSTCTDIRQHPADDSYSMRNYNGRVPPGLPVEFKFIPRYSERTDPSYKDDSDS
jgi:hypothetical protein